MGINVRETRTRRAQSEYWVRPIADIQSWGSCMDTHVKNGGVGASEA